MNIIHEVATALGIPPKTEPRQLFGLVIEDHKDPLGSLTLRLELAATNPEEASVSMTARVKREHWDKNPLSLIQSACKEVGLKDA